MSRAERRARAAQDRALKEKKRVLKEKDLAVRAKEREIRSLENQITKSDNKAAHAKAHRNKLTVEYEKLLDELLDEMARHGHAIDGDDDEIAASSMRAVTQLADKSLFDSLVLVKWHGATTETVSDVVAREVAHRIMMKRNLIYGLAIVDRTAIEVLDEVRGVKDVDVVSDRFATTVAGRFNDFLDLFQCLTSYGWQGMTPETADGVFARVVRERAVEMHRQNRVESTQKDFLSKLLPRERDAVEARFQKRVNVEYELCKTVREIGDVLEPLSDDGKRHVLEKMTELTDATKLAKSGIETEKQLAVLEKAHPSLAHSVRSALLNGGGAIVPPDAPDDPNCVMLSTPVMELLSPLTEEAQKSIIKEMQQSLPMSRADQLVRIKQLMARKRSFPPFLRRLPNDRPAGWFEHDLMRFGKAIWEDTYRLDKTPEDADNEARAIVRDYFASNDLESRIRLTEILSFSGAWAIHAFQRITTMHKYAAALMCSDVDAETVATIEDQWRAFLVIVPNGLLVASDPEFGDVDYSRILVATHPDRVTMTLVSLNTPGYAYRALYEDASTMSDLLLQESPPVDSATDRVAVMAKRLVGGLLVTMQTRENFKDRLVPHRPARTKRDAEEPAHRIVEVGKAISVDCRDVVKQFIAGTVKRKKGAYTAPSVGTVVTGHHKRQVCGVGRRDRKIIWIKPYWKNVGDAPILVRPKAIGPEAKN